MKRRGGGKQGQGRKRVVFLSTSGYIGASSPATGNGRHDLRGRH
jgi:hypothetical protein